MQKIRAVPNKILALFSWIQTAVPAIQPIMNLQIVPKINVKPGSRHHWDQHYEELMLTLLFMLKIYHVTCLRSANLCYTQRLC